MRPDCRATSWILIASALITPGCGRLEEVRDRSRQVGTYADLQEVSWNLKRMDLRLNDPGAIEQIKGVVDSVRQGSDRWGRPLRYSILKSVEEGSYVAYSTGADGIRDSEDDSWYFELTPRSIKGEFDRDIVFRDGRPVTNAGN